MTWLEVIGWLGLALVGFTLTGLFAGLETGLYTLSVVRLTVRAGLGSPLAIRLRELLRRETRTLTVLLIGTNASSYLGTFAATELLHGTGLTDWSLIFVEAMLITPVLFVFAETLPKDLFRTYTNRWTYWGAPAIDLCRVVFTWTGLLPLVQGLAGLAARLAHGRAEGDATARQRISHLIMEGVGAGVLTAAQATLTDRALAMREQVVDRVMVPWTRVVSLPTDAGRDARESLFATRNFTRLPVTDETGRVRGILTWVDAVLRPGEPTRELIQPPLAFEPGTRLLDALSVMREQRQPLAVVADPATGRPLGIVTLKDLVEPLTGKLRAW